MSRPRVLLADDHKIVTEGLKGLLEPEFELVGTHVLHRCGPLLGSG